MSKGISPKAVTYVAGYVSGARDAMSTGQVARLALYSELVAALTEITAGLNDAANTRPLIRASEVRAARAALAKAKREGWDCDEHVVELEGVLGRVGRS